MELDKKKCSSCKVNYTFDKFRIKSDESLTKMCIKCLERKKASKKRSKCEHGKTLNDCKFCDEGSYIASLVRNRVNRCIVGQSRKLKEEYINTDLTTFKAHIENKFTEGMTWDNYGKWQISHIIPLKYNNPTVDEIVNRLDYKNTQPLWKNDNEVKGNRLPDYPIEVEI